MPNVRMNEVTKKALEECEDIAGLLAHAAAVACTKAEQHEHAGEMECALKEQRRHQRNLERLDGLRTVIRLIKNREAAKKRGPCNRPTFGEVTAYAHEACNGWPERDMRKWYDHFESIGWLVSGRTPMKDWKAAVRNGYRNYQERNGASAEAMKSKVDPAAGDPSGWREFLISIGQRYARYKETSWLHSDFKEWLKKR